MINTSNDTIAAISTPIGAGGIGIVRVSGPNALDVARRLFITGKPSGKGSSIEPLKTEPKPFDPRQLYHGHIVDPDTKKAIDEVLIVYMPAPHSYTREDVVEIQAHGGAVALQGILNLILSYDVRLAEAGEFTRRAYLNGRIDLSQAEAVIDVIQAKTDAALRIANRNLGGGIRESVEKMREELFSAKVILEAGIDFPEDVGDSISRETLCQKMAKNILGPVDRILLEFGKGKFLREGLRLVILGKTNVGKSSLMNRLLHRDRVIVTEYPGTTRDSIEETIDILGLPVILVDTAGWRDTTDPVERMGIERTCKHAKQADLVLFMVDAGTGVEDEDEAIYERIRKKEKLLVINKIDLLKGDIHVPVPPQWEFIETLYTSVKFDRGLTSMEKSIQRVAFGKGRGVITSAVPNLRQKKLFERARKAIFDVMNGLKEELPAELVTIDLQDALTALDEITGARVKTDVLDEIFSRFCIGK